MNIDELSKDSVVSNAIDIAIEKTLKQYNTRYTPLHVRYMFEYMCSLSQSVFERGDMFPIPLLGTFKIKASNFENKHKINKLEFSNEAVDNGKRMRQKRLPKIKTISDVGDDKTKMNVTKADVRVSTSKGIFKINKTV